jgi:transposase
MRRPTKFVPGLTDEQKAQLKAIMKSSAAPRERMRAHAILLSARRYPIDQIAAIYEVDRDRVSQWLGWWSKSQFDGLADGQRSGRPPELTASEQGQVLEIVREEPRSTRRAVSEISKRLKKRSVGGR